MITGIVKEEVLLEEDVNTRDYGIEKVTQYLCICGSNTFMVFQPNKYYELVIECASCETVYTAYSG